ncbi:hypothetical protein FRC12_019014 [Ceratobasidium sp. 428]|nr:hypothetical protein FRC12_019014 [Ceratobasidium sp. 428]
MQFLDELIDDDVFLTDEHSNQTSASSTTALGANTDVNANAMDDINANGRRSRSDSEPNAEEAARLIRRAFMEATMDEHSIQGEAREQGRRFADLDPSRQMLFIFSFTLSQRSQVDSQAASNFLRSDVYETHVVSRIRCAMLLPWTCDYVKLFTETLVNNMLQHTVAWRLPDSVMAHAEQRQHLVSEFKVKTTQVRSQSKISMYQLRGKDADINQIMRKLAPNGMVITESHRARLAWIMLASVDFDELVEQKQQSRSKFWEWIGAKVLELKKKIQTDARLTTDAQRRTALTRIFSRALAKHREQFPPQTPVEPLQIRPAWQETLETSLDMGGSI